jgi:hypothetical protein
VTTEKVCNICKISKPITEFYKHNNCRYGVIGTCKACYSLKHKEKYRNDERYRDQCKEYAMEYYKQNTEQVKQNVKEWMKDHPEYVKRYVQKWQQGNLEHYRSYMREYLRGYRKRLKEGERSKPVSSKDG